MTGRNEDRRAPDSRVLEDYAAKQLQRLQRGYLRQDSAAKADLAQLRRADPARDEQLLSVWAIAFADAPEELVSDETSFSDDEELSPAERAWVSALCLYATHQQSKAEPMHVRGVGLGKAIRHLVNPVDADSREKPVMRRYHALTTANEMPELLHHLRGLVSLMRAEGVALDYVRLALDLYFLAFDSARTRVRLGWARDLTRSTRQQSADDTDATGTDA